MAYIVHRDKPYFFNGKRIYPCSISGDEVKVDFINPVKEKINISGIYTESEVRHKLGICMIDSWDAKNRKVIKVSNQTVSSLPEKGSK